MHKKTQISWAVAAVAAVLVLVVLPLGPEEGTLANALFVVQVLAVLVGTVALVTAIRTTATRRR